MVEKKKTFRPVLAEGVDTGIDWKRGWENFLDDDKHLLYLMGSMSYKLNCIPPKICVYTSVCTCQHSGNKGLRFMQFIVHKFYLKRNKICKQIWNSSWWYAF